jgi:hypothetical protein
VTLPPLAAFFERLEASAWGAFIHDKAWAFTTVELVHASAVSLLIGTIMIVDLRLVGVAAVRRPFTDLSRQVLPVTWAAFVTAVAAGALLFVSRASAYAASPAFWTKMALIVLAGVNMAAFEFVTVRGVHKWNLDPVPPAAARLAGLVSIACWVLVILCGRVIGFIGEGD